MRSGRIPESEHHRAARNGALIAQPSTRLDIDAFVAASAQVVAIPLDGERQAAVTAVMVTLQSFATDLAAFELADDVRIAGVFVP